MNIKRKTAIVLLLLMMIAIMSGCNQKDIPKEDKFSVVCTIFPQYDWVRQIIGDNPADMELTLLLNSRVDLHSYQPTVDNIAKISTCDLFIYIGGESDSWVDGVLRTANNINMIVINLLDELGEHAKEEEMLEGMQAEDIDTADMDNDELEYDEHVWLSLKNARIFCGAIAEALTAIDADNAEEYQSNLEAYLTKLMELDKEYQSAVDGSPNKTLLFGDRFPFRYLTDDYGLTPYAAFPGCSAETEASFDTIVFLASKVDELNLKNIIVTESADRSIAKTIIDNTKDKNQQIIELDAMQSVTTDDVRSGATYLSIMENNLSLLKNALN